MKWSLQLSLIGPFGERLVMAVTLDEHTAREIAKIDPPPAAGPIPLVPLEQVVKILKRREFRKDLLIGEARRLGALLAERMEDAEGWHDASRIEPAKRQLAGE